MQGIPVIFMCVEVNSMEIEVHFIGKEHLFYTNKRRCGRMICVINSRINSKKATRFRQWVTKTLKENDSSTVKGENLSWIILN